jgi:hypothetical protein
VREPRRDAGEGNFKDLRKRYMVRDDPKAPRIMRAVQPLMFPNRMDRRLRG